MIVGLFHKYQGEADYIGRILAGYTDLEFGLLQCVNAVRDDFDMVFKAMYRTRGETARITLADSIGRQSFKKIGLETEFAMAIGAMRRCMQFRNQYAHCVWIDGEPRSNQLGFADLERIAKSSELTTGLTSLNPNFLNLDLLKSQEEYFHHTDLVLLWLQKEALLRLGKIQSHVYKKPAQLEPPPLHIP